MQTAHLTRDFSQAARSTSRRTTLCATKPLYVAPGTWAARAAGAAWGCAATLERPPAQNDKEDRDGLVGGLTTTSDAQLGPTIAYLDMSGAEDEPGLVKEGARSQSSILNILHLNLQ